DVDQVSLAQVGTAVGLLLADLVTVPGGAAQVDDRLGHDAPPAIAGTCAKPGERSASRRSVCSCQRTLARVTRLIGPIQSICRADQKARSTKRLSQPGPPSRTMTASRLAR